MDLVMIEGFPFLEAYSPSMQDGPTIWMKMMLKFVIFEDSTSKLKLCTICKAQSFLTLTCRLKESNSATTYIFVVLDLLVDVCARNISKASPWRTNRNKNTVKVNVMLGHSQIWRACCIQSVFDSWSLPSHTKLTDLQKCCSYFASL